MKNKRTNIELQITRLKRIKKIIFEQFNDNIDQFSEFVGKNRHSVYSMLWDIENKNRRNITTDFAREIESKFNLPTGFLDEENETIAANLIDYSELIKYQEILRDILNLQQKVIECHKIIRNSIK